MRLTAARSRSRSLDQLAIAAGAVAPFAQRSAIYRLFRAGMVLRRRKMAGSTMHTAAAAALSRYQSLGLASLSLASGCIDVLSFLKFGDVFTSAMTGNTALLAIAIGQRRFLAASHSLCALLAFTLGVVLATMLCARWNADRGARRGLARILLLELVFLGGCAILWSASADPIPATLLYAVIALSALSMGIQTVGARSINSSGISTIVFTTGLVQIVTSAIGKLTHRAAGGPPPVSNAHLGTFAAFGLGAVLSALLVSLCVKALIWLPVAAVSCALGFSVLAERLDRNSA